MDFKFLKKRGIEEIQKLAGELWSDYNFHDPGITILEALAFALTELGYKSQYPVRDILAGGDDKKEDTLFAPSAILTSQPVNIQDYHKIILELDGIKDVIIFPSKRFPEFLGVYDLNIEVFTDYNNKKSLSRITKKVFETFHNRRNLCEDIFEVNFIELEPVTFEIDVEVNDKVGVADTYLKIYEELFDYISPTVRFQSLKDLLDKGMPVDEIFNGPLLNSGFLTEDEFERLHNRNIISSSDIIHFILDIEGVEMISKLNIIDAKGVKHKWLNIVERGKAFEINTSETEIRILRFGEVVEIQEDITQEKQKIEHREDGRLQFKKLTFVRKRGVERNLKEFHTIQNDFPEVYGIGELGLPPSAPNLRKAQAKQLKAYLIFFEQILANFYAQLDNLNQVFSIEEIDSTYFGQALLNVPGIEYLYKPFVINCIEQNVDLNNPKKLKKEWKAYVQKNKNEIYNSVQGIIEKPETFLDRRNRVLDHLLARFAFNYSDYSFDFGKGTDLETEQINHKRSILKKYIRLSETRSKAFNIIHLAGRNRIGVSGLEYRVKTLLKLSGGATNFPYDFYRKGFELQKASEKEEADKKLSLRLKKTNPHKINMNLFKYACETKNYQITDDEISILDENKKAFATIDVTDYSEKEINGIIRKLSRKLKRTSEKSEALFLIERILYRPHPMMRYFTFAVLYEDKSPAYINSGYLTFYERKERIEQIIEIGQKKENYSFRKISNQFKVVINDHEGNELLVSHRFLNSTKQVEEEIEQQIEYFSKIEKGEYDVVESFKFYTKHYDMYNLVRNPYSFILTILIPNWPTKFQNESFKTLLVETIRKELPAHIMPDIKWVEHKKLLEILDLCKNYQTQLRSEEPDYKELENISDVLFGHFLK